MGFFTSTLESPKTELPIYPAQVLSHVCMRVSSKRPLAILNPCVITSLLEGEPKVRPEGETPDANPLISWQNRGRRWLLRPWREVLGKEGFSKVTSSEGGF